MPYSGDCHVISCARDGQVRLGELSLTGICKGTKKLAQHKGAAHKVCCVLCDPFGMNDVKEAMKFRPKAHDNV